MGVIRRHCSCVYAHCSRCLLIRLELMRTTNIVCMPYTSTVDRCGATSRICAQSNQHIKREKNRTHSGHTAVNNTHTHRDAPVDGVGGCSFQSDGGCFAFAYCARSSALLCVSVGFTMCVIRMLPITAKTGRGACRVCWGCARASRPGTH